MINKYLHIVCLNVPYPADYGGVFDLFYKIKTLYELGVNIHLHCFEYGRGEQSELNKYCLSITYYKRKNFLSSSIFRLPFIVRSRANPQLLKNLLRDEHPVVLEGIHCTYYLHDKLLSNKKVMVRLHNVEYEYYKALAKIERHFLRKLYFKYEGALLKKYESHIANRATFIAVTEKDRNVYEQMLQAKKTKYLPVFLPFNKVTADAGSGEFCLYHGNLSIPENEKAVLWLLKNVFSNLDIPFVIAGKNPSHHIITLAHKNENVCVVANPSEKEMNELIKKAHIHVLPSFNKTGIKIKLLHALFNGRFVIANDAAVEQSGIETLCAVANTAADFKNKISAFFKMPFTEEDISQRKVILEEIFNNHKNAESLMQWIW